MLYFFDKWIFFKFLGVLIDSDMVKFWVGVSVVFIGWVGFSIVSCNKDDLICDEWL